MDFRAFVTEYLRRKGDDNPTSMFTEESQTLLDISRQQDLDARVDKLPIESGTEPTETTDGIERPHDVDRLTLTSEPGKEALFEHLSGEIGVAAEPAGMRTESGIAADISVPQRVSSPSPVAEQPRREFLPHPDPVSHTSAPGSHTSAPVSEITPGQRETSAAETALPAELQQSQSETADPIARAATQGPEATQQPVEQSIGFTPTPTPTIDLPGARAAVTSRFKEVIASAQAAPPTFETSDNAVPAALLQSTGSSVAPEAHDSTAGLDASAESTREFSGNQAAASEMQSPADSSADHARLLLPSMFRADSAIPTHPVATEQPNISPNNRTTQTIVPLEMAEDFDSMLAEVEKLQPPLQETAILEPGIALPDLPPMPDLSRFSDQSEQFFAKATRDLYEWSRR